MLKPESIVQRLQALRKYVQRLRPYQQWTQETLVDDFTVYMAVQHMLQLATQCVIDISSHILVALDLEPADDYEQVILNLGQGGVLPRDFAERIHKMAGFRNILVHGYLQVNPDRLYERLQYGLNDFESFIEHIYDFLQRQGYLDAET